MSLSLSIGPVAHTPWLAGWVIPIAAPILTFAGVAWGIIASGRRQIDAEDRRGINDREAAARQLAERQAVARTLVYAQVRRARLTALGHIRFIDDPENRVLYIAIYRSLFPSIEALGRVELLSIEEVKAITSFYYSYQEEIGFLTASAEEFVARREGTHSPIHVELSRDAIAYPLASRSFRDWGRERLKVIAAKADKAIAAIRCYCMNDGSGFSNDLQAIFATDRDPLIEAKLLAAVKRRSFYYRLSLRRKWGRMR